MKLIINADDFGITEKVNQGIIEAFEYGLVRSTTLFANTEHFDSSVELLKKNKGLKVGAHLTLTFGAPVSNNIPSIVNKKDMFFKLPELEARMRSLDTGDIRKEFEAQLQKLLNTGISITHLDTYQNIHRHPKINEVVSGLAAKHGIGIRKTDNPCISLKSTAEFSDKFYNESATALNLKMIVKKHEKLPSLEVVCHPGYNDAELVSLSRYNKKREIELAVLKSYELQSHFNMSGVTLCSFADL